MSLGTIGDVFSSIEITNDEAAEPEPQKLLATDKLEEEGELEAEPIVEEEPILDIELAWLRLIEHMVMDAGEKGVERIYTKLSTESPEFSIFSKTGFHPYTYETLYLLNYDKPIEHPANLPIRAQRKRDLWHIQRLYEASTPSTVQNAEQLQSDSWEISRAYYFPRAGREFGWVIRDEQGDKAKAYVRVLSHRNRHLIRIMNLDSERELLPHLLRFALSHIKPAADCQVFCSVRDYEAEQEAVLEEHGFKYFGRQAVLVKHTVHLIKSSEKALAYVRDRRLDLPQPTVGSSVWRVKLRHFQRTNQTHHAPVRPGYPRLGK
jgi:hypothetical protein